MDVTQDMRTYIQNEVSSRVAQDTKDAAASLNRVYAPQIKAYAKAVKTVKRTRDVAVKALNKAANDKVKLLQKQIDAIYKATSKRTAEMQTNVDNTIKSVRVPLDTIAKANGAKFSGVLGTTSFHVGSMDTSRTVNAVVVTLQTADEGIDLDDVIDDVYEASC